jgi:MoxR-like ATPase
VALIRATREREREKAQYVRFIEYGASPRASIYLYRCAKVQALFEGRSFVIPEDVKSMAAPVLRHRIILTYEAEAEDLSPDRIIEEVLKSVPVP